MSDQLDMFRLCTEINVSQLDLLSRQPVQRPEDEAIVRYAKAVSARLVDLNRLRDAAIKGA